MLLATAKCFLLLQMPITGLAIDGGEGQNQDNVLIIKQKGKVAALQQEILGMYGGGRRGEGGSTPHCIRQY